MTLREYFDDGVPFDEYLETVEKNYDLWHGVYLRARIPEDLAERLSGLTEARHLLVISEDWCGDAANILPYVARLAEAHDQVDMSIVGRDANPELMDQYLTGTSRSIPVVVVLDENWSELGWWGPRPSEIQRWVMEIGLGMESQERYKETRRWYARDRGRSILSEVLDRLEMSS